MILFYATEENRVVETLERLTAELKVVRCRSLATMVKCLRRPSHGLQVALVIVSSRPEMAQISEIQNLLRDLRLVVVVPRRDEEIVAWAHKLGPRFIAFADNGYEQVGAVLQKMIRSARRNAPKRNPVEVRS